MAVSKELPSVTPDQQRGTIRLVPPPPNEDDNTPSVWRTVGETTVRHLLPGTLATALAMAAIYLAGLRQPQPNPEPTLTEDTRHSPALRATLDAIHARDAATATAQEINIKQAVEEYEAGLRPSAMDITPLPTYTPIPPRGDIFSASPTPEIGTSSDSISPFVDGITPPK